MAEDPIYLCDECQEPLEIRLKLPAETRFEPCDCLARDLEDQKQRKYEEGYENALKHVLERAEDSRATKKDIIRELEEYLDD